MQAQPELMRQHQAYKAVRERLFSPRPVKKVVAASPPKVLLLRDFDEHVHAWRRWKRFSETLAKSVSVQSFSTAGTFQATLTPPPFEVAPSFSSSSEVAAPRRTMKEICLSVLQQFPGVTLEDLKGKRRTRYVVAARHTCMHAIYTERKDVSFPVLGRYFGGRDHTSCLAAVRKMENGGIWAAPPPPRKNGPAVRKLALLPEELDFLQRVRNGKLLKSSGAKDRSQELPRARMRNAGFAEFSKRLRRWVITEAGIKALEAAQENA